MDESVRTRTRARASCSRFDTWSSIVVGLVLVAIGAPMAAAQSLQRSTDPGVTRRRFDRPPAIRDERGGAVVPAPPRIELPEASDDVVFELRSVRLEGAEAIGPSVLAETWQSRLGREISLRDLYEIAAAITARYRNEGYILSRAIVPAQDVVGGEVVIRVIEGYVDDVVIEGDVDRKQLWEDHALRITSSRPLRAEDLERALLLLGDLPGVGVRSVLRPSEDYVGASTLVLIPSEQKILAYGDVNNRGTRYLGPYQGEVGVTLNSLIGLYDTTEIRAGTTFNQELAYVSADHTELLGVWGTTARVSGSYLYSNPGSLLQDLEVDGDSWTVGFQLRHPFIRSRALNASAFTSFDVLNSDNDLLGSTLSRDRTRVLRLGGQLDLTDRLQGISQLTLQASQGLDILDATSSSDTNTSQPGAEGEFTSFYVRAARLQRIGWGFNFLAQGAGQYALDPLLASEQFTFGGEDFGRGYDPAELIGDHGVAGLVELQWGRSLGLAYLEGLQLFGSYDFGAVWVKNSPTPGVGRRTSASSVAIGTRLNFTPWLAGRLTVALPLTRPPTIDRGDGEKVPRVFFGVTARY
jgi:hemolysin activation/secretion protein